MIRCGGWVDRGDGKGWVLDVPSQSAVVSVQPQPGQQALPPGGENTTTTRITCPDCSKDVAVNKDGTLRKHTCQIDAPPPEVSFDDGDGDA